MPSNKLTDQECKGAKPKEKGFKLFDGDGLFMFVSPKGSKVWRLQYRLGTRQQTLSIGSYPMVSLKAAREEAKKAREAIAKGRRPANEKAKSKSISFLDACETFWNGRQDISDNYRDNILAALRTHLKPLSAQPIGTITRDDMLKYLNIVNAKGHFDYVRKTRSWAAQVFDWAIEQRHAEHNPAREISPSKAFGSREVEHFAALPLTAVGEFLLRLGMERDLQSVLACKLLGLTWVRTTELRMMRWEELEGDTWRVPRGRMKKKRIHLVPLSKQAVAILDIVKSRSLSEYVFPNDRRLDRPMSENAILYLIGRIGYGGRMTGHGWRSMASTWANEREYNADAIERQLAHAPDDKVRAAYNHAQYLTERRQMLQDWADWLDQELENQRRKASMPSSPSQHGSVRDQVSESPRA